MRFPLVSRGTLESAERSALEAHDRLDQALGLCEELTHSAERANARYESLVGRMLDMKREGFKTVPLLTEPLKPSESALAPEVEFAIEEKSTGDPMLRRYLNTWSQRQTAAGTDPGAIANLIRYGDEAEENEA